MDTMPDDVLWQVLRHVTSPLDLFVLRCASKRVNERLKGMLQWHFY